MQRLVHFVALVLFIFNGRDLIAQVNLYSFNDTIGVYSEITADTVVASATSTNTNPGDLDNVIYNANTLPFSFTFNNIAYDNVVISTNGFITFGNQPPSFNNFSCISSSETYSGAIGVLSRDLIGTFGARCKRTAASNVLTNVSNFSGIVSGAAITGTGIPAGTTIVSFDDSLKTITLSNAATSSSSGVTTTIQVASGSIVRGTTGTAGSRVHTIQWKNFRRMTTTDTLENFNFQIRLYETSNMIEVIYGHMAKSPVTPVITVQVGLRGQNNSDYLNRATSSDWTATTSGSTNNANCIISPSVIPPPGLTFIWTPPMIFDDDFGIISASIGAPFQILTVGESYDINAVAKNFGNDTHHTVPVYYSVNGQSKVGPVNTQQLLAQNQTEIVTFNGPEAFVPDVPGMNTIKIFSFLTGDEQISNDTLIIQVYVQPKINSFPFVEKFSNPVNWTIVIEDTVGVTPLWSYSICTNPDGKTSDTAATSNCYTGLAGRKEILRSPVFDISSLTNPVVNFYLSHRSFTGNQDDSLEVLLSTDGGVNYFSPSTVFNKGNSSIPSLSTRNGQSSDFFPDSSSQWRHEAISLSNVQGSNNLVIGFRSKSNFGNRLWIDNFILSDNSVFCSTTVDTTGQYSCDSIVKTNFNSLGLSSTGTLSFQKHNINANDGQGIQSNAAATTQSGLIYTPQFVNYDFYYTVAFTGNDKNGYADYDISIDVSGYANLFDPANAYIMKRSDVTGKWVCLATTSDGNVIKASGLKTFSDFTIAYPRQTFSVTCRLELIKLNRSDTLTINFRETIAPYAIKESKKVIYDTLNGVSNGLSSLILNDSLYYIEVRHRNSVGTWSASPVLCTGNNISYDFTTGISQAYDSNMVLIDSVAHIYSGEITGDLCIDLTDINTIYNDAEAMITGEYMITDLNYDGIADLTDIICAYNNASAFVCEHAPLLKSFR